MAGGKETPRQKMIGMMYLVLTALLALNVSKSILDAFVAIEENIQKSNIAQLDRGNGFKGDVSSELKTTPNNAENAIKRKKLDNILKQMEAVDKITASLVEEIDKIKVDILEKSGEDVKTFKDNDETTLMWKKGGGVVPIRMHLMAVQAKDQYDIPMHEIIGEDIKTPTGSGKKLWEDLIKYRADLVKTVATYDNYSISPKAINDFKSNLDLDKDVTKMILASKANVKRDEKGNVIGLGEDGQALKDIYITLTKPERLKVNDMDGVHWIGATFDHSPLVAAVASLSSMQQDILSARAMALAHLKSKVSTGEYSFNKIVGLAYGPAIANTGDEVDIKVMMAAFDSDNQPTIGYGGTTFTGTEGMGIVKAKVAGGAEMVVSGTVSIKNKSGVTKTEPWEHTIKIMKPQGTVSLPELNVLYKGYDNKVEGVASGYDQTVLNGSNCSLSKSGNGYIARVSGGKEATISISGKNTVTNKTVSLGSYKFRVMNLPNPSLFWGAAEEGGKGSKNENKLFARYSNSPLNATFSIVDWEINVAGAPRPVKGTGNILSADAMNLLKQAKPGAAISFMTNVIGPDKIRRKKSGVFTI